MIAKRYLSAIAIAGLLGVSSGAVADEAQDLLSKMRGAVHTLTYSGTLVYAQGNDLTTYQIQHSVENGAEKESVIRLSQGSDGKTQESVESFSLAKFQPVQLQKEQVYSFDVGGQDWIAGQSCKIVVARPRDRMRYLQRYCIEPNSGMLLKYSLTDRNHQTVEQLLFTSLNLAGGNATDMAIPTPPMATSELKIVENNTALPSVAPSKSDWHFTQLPAGFQQVNQVMLPSEDHKAAVEQLILSDGMSSVSVFIASPDQAEALKSVEYSAGAMNIFTAQVDHHNVILVGEVPVVTLRAISEGLKHGK